MEDINQRIKELRHKLGMTQREFAVKLGVTQAAVCWLERSGSHVRDGNITVICNRFRVRESWLRDGKGEMFAGKSAVIRKRLSAEYGMSPTEVGLLQAVLSIEPAERDRIWSACAKVIHKLDGC